MASSYPHKGLKNGAWRRSTLYSIGGWMSSWYELDRIECGTAFGGYFRLDESEGHIEGEIIDTFGPSKIEGILEKDTLIFQKKYLEEALLQAVLGIINYRFEKVKVGDNWKGRFKTAKGSIGRAECKILPVVKEAFGLVIGPVRY